MWRIELEEPALLLLTRASRSAPASSNMASAPAKRMALEDTGPAPKGPRFHKVEGNIFKPNRKGKHLCEDFNRGGCTSAPGSILCPKNPGAMHQCSRCLDGSHGLATCPRADFPALKLQRNNSSKGGGKSKGKGKSGKKGQQRWQY